MAIGEQRHGQAIGLVLLMLPGACDDLPGKAPGPMTEAETAAGTTAAPPGPRLLQPTSPTASVLDIPELQGRWTVVAVAVADGRVQAYTRDDPAYMGQEMVIAGRRLSWRPPAAPTTATLDDVCTGAATMRLTGPPAQAAMVGLAAPLRQLGVPSPDPHEIACLDGGDWGGGEGGALLFPIDARTMAMRWYDNVVLKLRWAGPG